MASGKFDNPACKLRIEDVTSIQNEGGTWRYCDSEHRFKVYLVWTQGTIADISPDMDEIQLEEDNKAVIVSNCKGIPGGNDWMKLGQYIMVFGEIRAIQDTNVNIKAIKLSNISHNPLFKQMWPYEVKEAKLIYSELEGTVK